MLTDQPKTKAKQCPNRVHAQEMKRLRDKREEALSEAGTLRVESERLAETVETLRAAATAAKAAAADAEVHESVTASTQADDTEAQDEMARLRKTIEELKRALGSDGADGDQEGGRRDRDGEEETGGGGQERGERTQGTQRAAEERDGLKTELQQARQEAAARAAGLEMQLIDKEVSGILSSPSPHPTRPDPTRPDPTRPDPTRPDPTRPDPTLPYPPYPALPYPALRRPSLPSPPLISPASLFICCGSIGMVHLVVCASTTATKYGTTNDALLPPRPSLPPSTSPSIPPSHAARGGGHAAPPLPATNGTRDRARGHAREL